MAIGNLRKTAAAGGITFALMLASGLAGAAEKLGSYPVDPAKVSISGISSGAFMANQVHIAHSSLIMGAGIVAGGLYGCAVHHVEGDGLIALDAQAVGACMQQPDALKDVETYAERIKEFADRGWIDPLDRLKGARVYMFTGSSDKVVNSKVVQRGADLYKSLGVAPKDLKLVKGEAGHSWVTENFGVPCKANESPFINKCGYDQAKDILQHIYGDLKPAATSLSGDFVEFSQIEFAPKRKPHEHGLDDVGYLYVPKACEPGKKTNCALHVVLHGCLQSAQSLRDEFYKHVGVNEWADSNDIIVLYPQARTISTEDLPKPPRLTDLFETNPEGCWNWFGYGYDERFALKDGVQVTAIYKMIRRVMGEW